MHTRGPALIGRVLRESVADFGNVLFVSKSFNHTIHAISAYC